MTSTTSLYRLVIEDVVERVQDEFINAGIDETVLQDLKNLWQQKLIQSQVLAHEKEGLQLLEQEQQQQSQYGYQQNLDLLSAFQMQQAGQPQRFPPIVMPVVPGVVMPKTRMPSEQAPVNASLEKQPKKKQKISHSPAEKEDLDNEQDLDDEEDEVDALNDDEDEDGLGSDLDDDEDEADVETANIVLCQFEKVNRSKNKWKSQLKDGVCSINGRDYVFQKAQCDFEF